MKKNLVFPKIHKKLKQRNKEIITAFKTKHKESLAYLKKKGIDLSRATSASAQTLALGAATSALLMSSPVIAKNLPPTLAHVEELPSAAQILKEALLKILPEDYRHLSKEEETLIEEVIKNNLGVNAKVELAGYRLNKNWGLIGAEQHLLMFPGDNLSSHLTGLAEKLLYSSSRIAPHRGAWGYFSTSKAALTAADITREKYYVAVPTFLSPNWNLNMQETSKWFKYRKVIIINPNNGYSVVAVVADAGPASYTGKTFGGSPEVMHYLGLSTGGRKGGVIILFVDDPADQVPLGPIDKVYVNFS